MCFCHQACIGEILTSNIFSDDNFPSIGTTNTNNDSAFFSEFGNISVTFTDAIYLNVHTDDDTSRASQMSKTHAVPCQFNLYPAVVLETGNYLRLKSPNFPKNYSSDFRCGWKIQVREFIMIMAWKLLNTVKLLTIYNILW